MPSTSPDPLTASLLAAGPYVRDAAPHRLLRVDGPDAGDFLQRLCTQDVLGLPVGGAAFAAFLDAKGKVQVTAVAAREGGAFLLETQASQHERLLALLDRYHFAEKIGFSPVAGTCRERIAAAAGDPASSVTVADGVVALRCARRGVRFERWHAADAASLPKISGAALGMELAECLRMGAGLVAVGIDTEASTLALEADLADHCSTTKGCYTGQEIVARIQTYGHTNRALCLLHLGAGPAITAPQTLHEMEDKVAVGRVMAAVPVPGRDLRVGLGYLPKDFQAIGTKLLLADGAAVTVAGFGA